MTGARASTLRASKRKNETAFLRSHGTGAVDDAAPGRSQRTDKTDENDYQGVGGLHADGVELPSTVLGDGARRSKAE